MIESYMINGKAEHTSTVF